MGVGHQKAETLLSSVEHAHTRPCAPPQQADDAGEEHDADDLHSPVSPEGPPQSLEPHHHGGHGYAHDGAGPAEVRLPQNLAPPPPSVAQAQRSANPGAHLAGYGVLSP